MSRVVEVVVALALAAGASGARAQNDRGRGAPARDLLARAQALQAEVNRGDSLARAEQSLQRRATRFDAGALTVLLPALTEDVVGRRIASGAVALLDDLGAVPKAFLASHVVVSFSVTQVDSVLRAAGLAARARVRVDAGQDPDTLTGDWAVAAAVASAYRLTLDAEWRAWLPFDLGVGWKSPREGEAAVRELLGATTRVGGKCLEGGVAECRKWLGLDRDANPFAIRYRPAELRSIIAGRWFPEGNAARLARECEAGSDVACTELASTGAALPPIPAGYSSRNSLIRAVRALHGAVVVQQALADTAGSLGGRLERAAGIGEDSLVAEWRTWLLTGGGHPRVTADTRVAWPALTLAGLLLLAAARSGRWR
jgi:hypothetical protein